MYREEKTYTILPKKLSEPITQVIDSYCKYRACQNKSFESIKGKRFVLGGGQNEELLSTLDGCFSKYKKFYDSAEETCLKLQKINGFPEYANVTHNKYQEEEEDYIFFNNAVAGHGTSYKINEEILIFLLLNSEKNVKNEALSERNYHDPDSVYDAILKETLTKLESSIGSVDIWEYPH